MSEYYNAFEMSPVPSGPDAVAPEPYRGIYAMPMFVTIPTPDLAASTDFWRRGLGFVDLFSIPGRLVHLRRWAFQDVLVVPADPDADTAGSAVPAVQVNVACVLGQLEPVAAACRELSPHAVSGPYDTPWNTRDIAVVTPERARVVFTAARPFDPNSAEADNLAAVGIIPPPAHEGSQ